MTGALTGINAVISPRQLTTADMTKVVETSARPPRNTKPETLGGVAHLCPSECRQRQHRLVRRLLASDHSLETALHIPYQHIPRRGGEESRMTYHSQLYW